MHKILNRQLKSVNFSASELPKDKALWKSLLQKIDSFYQSADHERYLLEQALNISSEEMHERWERINDLLSDNEKHNKILKSQNKILSSISKNVEFKQILKTLAHEIAFQLDLKKTIIIQTDHTADLFYIATDIKQQRTEYTETPITTKTTDDPIEFLELNHTQRYDLSGENDELSFFKKKFPQIPNSGRLWYIPILGNNNKYPSYLFLQPATNTPPTDYDVDIINSIIQMVNLNIHGYESEKRLQEEQVKVISAGKKAALGEMAGGIAHEINNPLAIISGQTQKLKLLSKIGKIDEENLNDSADKILKTIDRLSRIVYALRAFSRDDTKIEKSVSNFIEIMDNSLALCSEKIKNSGVELKTNYSQDQLPLFCNSVQISQVIVNLISNAYDAIKDLDEPWISIEVSTDSTGIKIILTDSGDGISEEIQEKIMQPFFTTKEVGHGTGIGLSLSQGIIKEHEGSLEYNSNSKNTQFLIHLPLYLVEEEKAAS